MYMHIYVYTSPPRSSQTFLRKLETCPGAAQGTLKGHAWSAGKPTPSPTKSLKKKSSKDPLAMRALVTKKHILFMTEA